MIRPHPGTKMTLMISTLATLIVAGCGESHPVSDHRLAELSKHSIDQQARQNELIARQSQSVADQSDKLTEAAKELVASDAEARREMVEATRQLNSELHEERGSLDRQYESLEQERRQIAGERHRDPIIATVLHSIGLLLVCSLPLLVCIYVLRQVQQENADDKVVSELLIEELTTEQPLLLPPPQSIEPQSNHPTRLELRPPVNEENPPDEPPF